MAGAVLVLMLAALPPLGAVEEDESRMIKKEEDETVELIPETIIPWHESLLELPQWMSAESDEVDHRIRPANQGAGLFPTEVWPLQPEPSLGPLIWDEALAGIPSPSRRGRVAAPLALGPEMMARYTAQPPAGVLVDPQHLAPGGRVESLVQRWLNDQCVFRTTLVLFGEGQQLPADFDPQALRRQWFGSDPEALLVFFFQHEPERTLSIFGPEARTRYGADLLRSVVDAAVAEAGRAAGPAEQLDRFCYKMSVRLHWLDRAHPLPTDPGVPGVGPTAPSFSVKTALLLLLLTAGLAAGGLVCFKWHRRRQALRQEVPIAVSLLPQVEFQARFGAPHSGGFSSMITFTPHPAPPGA